ncbi:MAG TPA: O-antigen ligase family protein [Bacteroidales bacterium]|nr:O-antigen ligase family protein [Bacteroidales bacterium]HRZ48020.1 O-antigen ligase family protein [Bacteroidales bacterium]
MMLKSLWSRLSEFRFQKIYLAGLALFAAGLPLSKTALSLSLGLLGIHWLLAKGWKHFPAVRTREWMAFYLFLLIPLIHLAGLWNTSDLPYALKDLRIKLPLLLLPVFMATSPALSQKQIHGIFRVFIAAVTAGTFITLVVWLWKDPLDPRDLVPFNNHIRYSMMVCIALFLIVFRFIPPEQQPVNRGGWIVLSLWLIASLLLLESLTGILALLLGILTGLCWVIIQKKYPLFSKLLAAGAMIMVAASAIWLILYLKPEFQPDMKQKTKDLERYSASGNPYFHDTVSWLNENGNLVWIYVAEEEMRAAWNRRSRVPYDHQLESGYRTGDILLRFLSSRGLRKDANGVAALTDEEVTLVEKGVTNYKYSRFSWMRKRVDQLKWEYWNYRGMGNPRGHSVMQRLELWNAGLDLACSNLLTGVGTGDVKRDFAKHLAATGSPLAGTPLRAHNQFLTIFIAFGIPGLLLFLTALAMPLILNYRKMALWFAATVVILYFSLLTEDTLETQAGVSLFSFFMAFNLFQPTLKNTEYEKSPETET